MPPILAASGKPETNTKIFDWGKILQDIGAVLENLGQIFKKMQLLHVIKVDFFAFRNLLPDSPREPSRKGVLGSKFLPLKRYISRFFRSKHLISRDCCGVFCSSNNCLGLGTSCRV